MTGCWQCDEGELDAVCTCGKGVDVWCDPGGGCCCTSCCGCDLDD